MIVAGFQGLGSSGEVTTLGRGGSDTSALALAGALGAECCEIYSDVPGVYTADPRIVDEPLHLKQLDSALMAEYALHGARVLHPACIAMARQKGVAIHARSTFGEPRFTRIRCEADLAFSACATEAPPIVGVASRKSRIYVRARRARRGSMSARSSASATKTGSCCSALTRWSTCSSTSRTCLTQSA